MIPFCSEDESNYQAGTTSVAKLMMGSLLRRRTQKNGEATDQPRLRHL
jgi:hypothetical protein